MSRAVFLDRDGTVTKYKGFTINPDEVELEDYAAEGIKLLNSSAFKVIVVTNQPQVARGMITEEGVDKINQRMIEELEKQGAKIDAVYFCPHHPETHQDIPPHAMKYRIECECRKPNTGMLEKAAKKFGVDLSKSFVIGDRTVDVQTGKNAGCKTILLRTGDAGQDKKHEVKADYECEHLMDAAKVIAMLGVKAVILAGGCGERLKPITDNIPKPMIDIAGKPLLQHQIEALRRGGVTEIILCGSYLVNKIKEYFGSGEVFGVKMYYPEEPEQLGTGGAVGNASEFLKDADRFIIINGDKMIGNFDFSRMLEFDRKKRGFATILVRETEHPLDSDILRLDTDGRVAEFIGRGQDKYRISNSGIIVSGPALLKYIPPGKSNIERDVVFKLIDREGIYGFVLPNGWFTRDIGTPERLESVRKRFETASS